MIRGALSSVPLLGAACLLLVTRAQADDACASPPVTAALAAAGRVSALTTTTTVKCTSVWVIDATRIRREPDRCTVEVSPSPRVAEGTGVPPVTPRPAYTAACEPPWVIDAAGIQRLRPECLAGPAAAATPEAVSKLDASLTANCEPPWFIDAAGIQRLRPDCLAAVQVFPPTPPARAAASVAVQPKAPPTGSAPSAPPGCDPVFFVDEKGIRRLKPKCL